MPASKALETAPVEERNDPRPLLVALIVLCSIFVVTYALRLDERDRVEAAIVAQRAANEDALARGAELRQALTQVARPSYLDGVIRKYLGMGKKGDIRLAPVDAPGLAEGAQQVSAEEQARAQIPVWQQWLLLFTPRMQPEQPVPTSQGP